MPNSAADSAANPTETPAPGATTEVFVPGPAGRLQALLSMPKTTLPRGLCVVCHPHPLFGGALTNKVVYSLSSCALKAGLATLRFNFRGVEKSAGLFDESRGETEDALAAADWLRAQFAGQLGADAPFVLAGFSFGAYVALKSATRTPTSCLVTVSVPFGRYVDGAAPPPRPSAPWLAAHSHDDEVVAFDATAAVLKTYSPPPDLIEFDGAGHFYHGRLTDLQSAVQPFIERSIR